MERRGLFLLFPGWFGLGIFVYALAYSLYMSFFRYKLGFGEPVYVGLKNFVDLFNDPVFNAAVVNTLLFVVAATAIEMAYGIALALLLYWSRYRPVFLPLLLIPALLPAVNLVVLWRFLLHPDYGLVNQVLRQLGLPPINPLNDPTWALPTIVLMDIWQMSPFVMALVFAGLTMVPREVITAARIDGAGRLATATKILLPLAKNVILAVALLRLIDAFRIFAKVYLLTKGGPGVATETLELQIYERGLKGLEIGLGSAMSTVLTSLAVAVIIPYLWLVVRQWRR